MARELYFSVQLSADEVLGIYNGTIKRVMVLSDTGLRVELNAQHFRPFTSRSGISGRFKMLLDDNNRMLSLARIS
jgi:hypothetical protein